MSESARKIRLDKLLADRGLAVSRERAQALILAGRVLVNEQKQTKPGLSVDAESALRVLGHDLKYVSRGGLKLEAALQHWAIDLNGRDCLDVGASTGGFTDCMLQSGAASVLAVDTGWGQIAQTLRSDPRVALLERTNARKLSPGELLEKFPDRTLTFLSMDVSFISATLVLPAVLQAAPSVQEAVILVKPQFEAGREWVGKGGIVRDAEAHALAQQRVLECAQAHGAESLELIDSPITGAEGNREFLLHALWKRG
jgi:23S rRNA (cytidine1920-2'-O)/16S rRNA (cytidine1409-2'-O)-methyltransferase